MDNHSTLQILLSTGNIYASICLLLTLNNVKFQSKGEQMPIIKSAKKALRSSEKKRLANEKFKKELKEVLKKTNSKNLNLAYSKLDKAVKKHLMHRNKAARLKSRLAKKFNSETTKKPAATKVTKVVKKAKTVKKSTKKTTVKKSAKK